MSHEKTNALSIKYNSGNCTNAEKALVKEWLFQEIAIAFKPYIFNYGNANHMVTQA